MDSTTNIGYTISIDGISDLLTQLGKLQQALGATGTANDGLNTSLDDTTAQLKPLQEAEKQLLNQLQQHTAAMQASKNANNGVTDSLGNQQKQIVGLSKSFDTIQGGIKSAAKQFYTLKQTLADSGIQQFDEAWATTLKNGEDNYQNYTDNVNSIDQAGKQQQLQNLSEQGEKAKTTLHQQLVQYLSIQQQANDKEVAMEADKQQRKTDIAQKALQPVKDITTNVNDAIFTIENNNLQAKEQQDLDALKQRLDKHQITQKQYDAQKKAIEKKAFDDKKELDTKQALINGALAITLSLAQLGPIAGAIAAVGIAASTAAQVAVIQSKKFARGGWIPFARGGTIQGPNHAQGGVSFIANGQLMEAEGGELIVNRNIWRRPDFVKTISAMNEYTGGTKFFASGGVVPSNFIPTATYGTAAQPPSMDTNALIKGLRGVIASEVGSLKVVNNVVDTSAQQTRVYNLQVDGSF